MDIPNPNNELTIKAEDQAVRNHDEILIVDDQINHNDPYRTAYHFQPPQNWMNGNFFLLTPTLP